MFFIRNMAKIANHVGYTARRTVCGKPLYPHGINIMDGSIPYNIHHDQSSREQAYAIAEEIIKSGGTPRFDVTMTIDNSGTTPTCVYSWEVSDIRKQMEDDPNSAPHV